MDYLEKVELTGIGNPLEIRQKIWQLEIELRKKIASKEFEEGSFPLRHQFSSGMYIRSVFLPKGTTVIGKLHRHECFNYLSKGEVTVVTEHTGIERFSAYKDMISPPACKRAIFVHEDAIWTVVHLTNETDLSIIESQVIAPSYSALGLQEPIEQLLTIK